MPTPYDVIFLGGGHNTLVAQAYAARAGLRTCLLERATQVGGALTTVENPRARGFLHNTHSFYHRGIPDMPWYRDLELEGRGATYIEPELNVAVIFPGNTTLEWWSDVSRTVESVARFSSRDAATLRRLIDEFTPIVSDILIPEAQSVPLEPQVRERRLRSSAAGRRLLEVTAASPLEFVQSTFEHDAVRAGLLFFNGLREIDLRLSGFGHAIPSLLASRARAAMCVGGSSCLARSLESAVVEAGGEIRTECTVQSILVEGNQVRGVRVDEDDVLSARAVASGLNPQQTFLDLLPEGGIAPRVADVAREFRYNRIAPLFACHLALKEPPRYRAFESRPELARAFMVVTGLEGMHTIETMIEDHGRGDVPPCLAWGSCPTLFDPTQAPEGRHTAFLWSKVPYALRGSASNWEDERDAHSQRLLESWRTYAPNLHSENIVDHFTQTPPDTVEALPNMIAGDLLVGSFERGQVGYGRPFVGAGAYRTPLEGLYLCGSSTHPGGNVTGLCGYNAAQVIVDELGGRRWWV